MSIRIKGDLVTFANPVDPSTTATVTKKGATLISFKVKEKEYLFLSEKADTSTTTQLPVRGGVPIIFPAFGKSYLESLKPLKQHGFARNLKWDFIIGEVLNDFTVVKFKLSTKNCVDDPDFKKWCETYNTNLINFELFMIIELYQDKINLRAEIGNINMPSLEFQFLFHTYFKIPDVRDMYITGLQNLKYVDRLQVKYKTSDAPMFKVTQQTDSLFKLDDTVQDVDILSGDTNIRLNSTNNLNDLVVWNPWSEGVKNMKDFEPKSGYRDMICVEFGSVEGETVGRGETWSCEHSITIM